MMLIKLVFTKGFFPVFPVFSRWEIGDFSRFPAGNSKPGKCATLFQINQRWSNFRPQYCELKTSKWACIFVMIGGSNLSVPIFKLCKTITYVS